jgi:hypothetical protein
LAESRLPVNSYANVSPSAVSASSRDDTVVYGSSLSCTFARTVTGALAEARKVMS